MFYSNCFNFAPNALCRKVFAKAGYRVALIARNADHLNKTAADVQAFGGEVCHI